MTQFLPLIGTLFPFLLLSVFLVTLIGLLVAQRRWQSRGSPSLKGSLRRFKVSLALLAIYLGIAAVTVQTLTTGLNSFGYPDGPADVQTAEQILNYLQQYNRGIMANTYALLWFFYAFAVWFLTTLYAFAQAVVKALLAQPHS
ncbi:MAG: hypothetical protein AAGH78_18265 [Cyanobacteria bacterium P01_H01_bin.58]